MTSDLSAAGEDDFERQLRSALEAKASALSVHQEVAPISGVTETSFVQHNRSRYLLACAAGVLLVLATVVVVGGGEDTAAPASGVQPAADSLAAGSLPVGSVAHELQVVESQAVALTGPSVIVWIEQGASDQQIRDAVGKLSELAVPGSFNYVGQAEVEREFRDYFVDTPSVLDVIGTDSLPTYFVATFDSEAQEDTFYSEVEHLALDLGQIYKVSRSEKDQVFEAELED